MFSPVSVILFGGEVQMGMTCPGPVWTGLVGVRLHPV